MTTVGDAIKAALDANWNVGLGGTEPALYSSEDVGKELPTDPDWIKVLGWTYRRKRRRRNDSFIGERYLIDLLVHSMNDANSEERLDEIVTEIYRLITPTNVTGYHNVDITDESRAASDDYMHFMATLTVELTIKSTAAAAVPGSVASTATIDALLMYGSANAAWVPCTFMVEQGGVGKVHFSPALDISNIDGTDSGMPFELPIPTVKVGLKLWISGYRLDISDADATNKVDRHRIVGSTFDSLAAINDDGTDRTAPAAVEETFTAVDCSGYHGIYVFLNTVCADANALGIQHVALKCYYAA